MPNMLKSAIFVNGNKIEMDYPQFNGGERNIKVDKEFLEASVFGMTPAHSLLDYCNVYALLFDSSAIMDLLLVCDAVRRQGVQDIRLTVPYVPYARQDRVMVKGESLSIKVMCDLINSIQAISVTIFDPHSDVTSALINNVVVKSQEGLIAGMLKFDEDANILSDRDTYPDSFMSYCKDTTVVAPDGGAAKKAYKVAKTIVNGSFEKAGKIRDVTNGDIVGVSFKPDASVDGKTLLIPDDISDGGYSFLYLAKHIKENHNPEKIGLLVTHGLFAKGVDDLKKYLDNIYAIDYSSPSKLKILELK